MSLFTNVASSLEFFVYRGRRLRLSFDYIVHDLLSILQAANALKCKDIANAVIMKLEGKLDAIDRLQIGRQRGIAEWIQPAYRYLWERSTSLSLEEGKRLSVEDTVKIAQEREIRLQGGQWKDVENMFEWTR